MVSSSSSSSPLGALALASVCTGSQVIVFGTGLILQN